MKPGSSQHEVALQTEPPWAALHGGQWTGLPKQQQATTSTDQFRSHHALGSVISNSCRNAATRFAISFSLTS